MISVLKRNTHKANKMKDLKIVNNSGGNLDFVWDHIMQFVNAGVIHEDIADVFTLERLQGVTKGYKETIVVDFA